MSVFLFAAQLQIKSQCNCKTQVKRWRVCTEGGKQAWGYDSQFKPLMQSYSAVQTELWGRKLIPTITALTSITKWVIFIIAVSPWGRMELVSSLETDFQKNQRRFNERIFIPEYNCLPGDECVKGVIQTYYHVSMLAYEHMTCLSNTQCPI